MGVEKKRGEVVGESRKKKKEVKEKREERMLQDNM